MSTNTIETQGVPQTEAQPKRKQSGKKTKAAKKTRAKKTAGKPKSNRANKKAVVIALMRRTTA